MAFLTNYPNCTTINGSLTFDNGYQTDVSTDFANLQRINGDLNVWDTEIIGAFTALDTIMGGIGVSGHSPDGLDAELHADFPVLKYVGGGIGVGGSESGYIAPGIFPVLERVEGGLGSCYQWGNPFPLTDFPSLKYIGGSITVDYPQISGLNAVDTIAGDIHFQSCVYNQISVQITGLNQLKYIGGDVIFNDTHFAINLSGMTALNAIRGNLSFNRLWPTSVNGLEQLKYIGGSLDIQRAKELTNLDFLSMLESVGGDVILNNNYELNNIDGLNHAISIGGQLDISDNSKLSQCAVQAVCEHINANGVTVINNNDTYCDNLSQVEQICNETCPQGDLILTTQQEVDNFAINYLECIGINGNLVIHGITPNEITNLDGLASLYSISDTLFIINNESLTDISGLENIVYSSMSHVQISDNTALSECSIISICRYISYGGTTLIYNNGVMCNSANDVLDNCTICPTGNITLKTQEEVDEYAVLYPGCKIVQHSITVQGLNDITNVHGLIGIERIEKRLKITNCNALTELIGLDSLKYIGNDLSIWYNNTLTDISSLHNLSYVDDNFFISGNDALTTLAGLDKLTNAYELYLFDNDALVDISSLHNLKSILGLYINDNQSLTHLNGLEGITNLFFGLEVKGNDALIDLSGLNNLTHVSEKVDIGGNNSLQSLQGLNGLTFVGEDFIIGRYLHTYSNPALQTLAGLDNLNRVNGLLVISQNESLTSFNSLNNLNYVGMLSIENNDALTNFNGLQNLTTVGQFSLFGHDNLSSLDGLESLQTGQNLRIEDNNSLNSLSGLDNIDYTTMTDLSIKENSNLSICNVQSICDYLENGGSSDIQNNAPNCNSAIEVEESCNALPIELLKPLQVRLDNKTAILQWRTATEMNNSGFEIQRSKDGIEWERIGWQEGQGNTTTPQTYSYRDPNPIFGTSYYRLKQVDFNGDAEYSNVVSLRYIRNGVTVYPNPVKERLSLHTDYGAIQQIVIYDSTGRQVNQIAKPLNNIDVSILPKGIYIIKITLEDEDFYEKIIVE